MGVIFRYGAAFLLTCALWEGVARLTLVNSPGVRIDPVWGRLPKAGTYVHGTEGYAWTSIDANGMRTSALPSLPGVSPGPRVLMLGDSYTEGFQVPDTCTFSHLVGSALRPHFPGIEVLNAGRSGASPATYLHLAPAYLRAWQPQRIVIQVTDADFTGDLLDASKNFYLKPTPTGFETVRSPDYVSSNAILRRIPALVGLRDISLVKLLGDRIPKYLGNEPTPEPTEREALSSQQRSAITWTFAQIHRRLPSAVVVYVPTMGQEDPDTGRSPVEAYALASAAEAGVDTLEMRTLFTAYEGATRGSVRGFANTQPGVGHINRAGHMLIAKRVVAYLEAKLRP